MSSTLRGLVVALSTFAVSVGLCGVPRSASAGDEVTAPPPTPRLATSHLDRTGRKRVGKASFYANKFAGKKMADGTPMHPQSDNAASKTLPLGTTAKVTDLETGKSAVVTIRDRGPYVEGRIVDLSPSTAQKIGIDPKEGVAKVEVAPIAVPSADGTVKPGVANPVIKKQRAPQGWDN